MSQITALGAYINIGQRTVKLNFKFCSDWKMLALLMGLKAANSVYCCPWCMSSKKQRQMLDVDWSVFPRSWDSASPCLDCSKMKEGSKSEKKCRLTHKWEVETNLLKQPFNRENCLLDSLHCVLRTSELMEKELFASLSAEALDHRLQFMANKGG